jgi:hypothetical protein
MVRERLRFLGRSRDTSYRETDDWQKLAACRTEDPELFTLVDVEHVPSAKEVNGQIIKEISSWEKNKMNLEKAEQICFRCPVKQECWENSDDDDKKWTLRGGAWPEMYREPTNLDTECADGHEWSEFTEENKDCRHCGFKRFHAAKQYKTRYALDYAKVQQERKQIAQRKRRHAKGRPDSIKGRLDTPATA